MSAASGATVAARGMLLLRRAAAASSSSSSVTAAAASASSLPSSATGAASSARLLRPPRQAAPQQVTLMCRRGLATSTSTSTTAEGNERAAAEAALPHLQRPTDAELEAMDLEDEETSSNMKDGLAIKMATSSFAGRRRFYRKVGVRAKRADNGDNGAAGQVQHFEVTLDGYPLKTPGTEKPYRLPTRGLALAVALEWDQQVTYKGVEPTYMPITGMATIALDEIIFSRQSTIDRCLRYLATDTVCFCFPDEEEDRKLLRRQQKAWEPLLAWLRDDFGVHIAKPTHLLSTCENTPETLRKVAIILSEMDAFTLAGTLSLVLDLKSVITALALVFRHITVEEACQASALEEMHQKAAWGHVDLYHELDETVLYSQVAAASTYLWLLDEDQLKIKDLKGRIKARLRQEFPNDRD